MPAAIALSIRRAMIERCQQGETFSVVALNRLLEQHIGRV